MTVAHRRHDMTDAVWERLRPHLPGGEGQRGRPAQETGGLSTPCAGYCAPALLGEICPRTTEIGRTPPPLLPLAGPGRVGRTVGGGD